MSDEQQREWTITRLRGGLALTFYRDGRRARHSLGTSDPREAYRLAPAVYAELTRPTGRTVADLWAAYTLAKAGKPVLATMEHTWKAIKPNFGDLDGEAITSAHCREHTRKRRAAGIGDGTIHTELGHLRTVLVWAEKKHNPGLISRAPDIERPAKPDPKDRHLTKQEAAMVIANAKAPHVRTAMHLMLATAARVTALLELTWDRVDFKRRLIYLRKPNEPVRRKGRATVPINNTLFAVLQEAQQGALSEYVIEWAGGSVKSLKRGIKSAAKAAYVDDVSAHVFRHTAGVWMAEAGVSMDEISQYMGHSNVEITRRVYARFSPDYLRKAAAAMELGLYVVPSGSREPR